MSSNCTNDISKNEDEKEYNDILYTFVIVVVALCVLLKNRTVRYYFNYTFLFCMSMVSFMVAIPFVLLRPKNPGALMLLYPFARLTAFIMDISLELRGTEILMKEEAGVLTVNHQSSIDLLAHFCIMNIIKKSMIVSRIELFYLLPYGLFMLLAGSVFVNRNNGRSAYRNLLSAETLLAEHKAKLLIYPEGHRYLNAKELLPFKKGAFTLAIKGQFPIVPMVISPLYFINAPKSLFRSGGNIIMKVLDPISTKGLTSDDINSLLDKTWNVMNDEYQKLTAEVESY